MLGGVEGEYDIRREEGYNLVVCALSVHFLYLGGNGSCNVWKDDPVVTNMSAFIM